MPANMSSYSPEAAAAEVHRRLDSLPAQRGGRRIVLVDGPSGSGKTTLGNILRDELGAALIHMDDIYPGWDGLEAGVEVLRTDVLEPMSRGEQAAYRSWDWDADRWDGRTLVPDADTIVVEGSGASAGPGAELADLRVWLEADEPTRHGRAMARDGETYRPHWERWRRQEDDLFTRDRTRARADLVLRTGKGR